MFYRPFALRDHVTSFLRKWKLHDFAFEKRLVGHILNKIEVIWFFQTRPIFLKYVSSYLVTWPKCALSIFGIRKIQTHCLTEVLVTWPPIGMCSGRLKLRQSIICFTLKSFFPFALCPLPLPFIASFTWAVFIFQFILLLFPTKPAAKNRSYSLTCIFSGCASSPNRILQLFTRSTWKINSHLYFEEFSKCDRTYPTGMNHGAG